MRQMKATSASKVESMTISITPPTPRLHFIAKGRKTVCGDKRRLSRASQKRRSLAVA